MNILDRITVLLLKRLKPGYLPEMIFNEMQRINHCLSVELLIFRDNKVWLEQRLPGDKYWPNEWHIPGTMVRGNESPREAVERLLGDSKVETPTEVVSFGMSKYYSYQTKRGYITHLVYTVKGNIEVEGKFFDIKRLPQNIMEHHRLLLKGKL